MRHIILLLMALNLYAIMSIYPVEIGDKKGFSGKLKGSLETRRGNTDKDSYDAGVRLKYDSNTTYLLWYDFSFSYGKSSGTVDTNKKYSHLRYIHTLFSKELNYELFAQSTANEFTKVKRRHLGGGGLRYKFDLNNYGNIYIGLGGFYEYISYTTQIDPKENNIRINSYLAYKKKFSKEGKLAYIGYLQPKIDDINDYVISNAVELEILVYKKLYLSFAVFYDIDSQPAVGVEKMDFTQKTSFIYKF